MPSRRKEIKIGVSHFRNRICPRFDSTPEMLIVDIDDARNESIESVDTSRVTPERVIEILADKKVRTVIAGGMEERFQAMLHARKIDVIWGVAGQVNHVLRAFRKGRLQCGIGNVDRYRSASSVSASPKKTRRRKRRS